VHAEILSPWKAFINAEAPLDLMASVLAAYRGLSGDVAQLGPRYLEKNPNMASAELQRRKAGPEISGPNIFAN
jgi:hypothetical protein